MNEKYYGTDRRYYKDGAWWYPEATFDEIMGWDK